MASPFKIDVQVGLSGPYNLKPVVSAVQNAFSGLRPEISPQVSPAAVRQLRGASAGVKGLSAGFRHAAADAKVLGRSVRGVGGGAAGKSVRDLGRQVAGLSRDLSGASDGFRRASNFADAFGQSVGRSTRNFGAFLLVVKAVDAVQRAFAAGVREAAEFQHEMVRLGQVGGTSAADVRSISAEVTKLATTLGTSSATLARTATTLRQAGHSAAEVRQEMEALAKTTLAPTFESIENTTEGVIALRQQFAVAAKDIEGHLGSVNTVAAEFAVESEDLVAAVRKTGGAFRAASGDLVSSRESFNQLLGLFTSVRQTTRESADEIATGLRTIFGRIQSTRVSDALKDMGINLRFTRDEARQLGRDVEGQFVGAYEAVRRLSSATKGLQTTDPRFAQIAEQIGGYRQISRVIPLLQQFSTAQRAYQVAQSGSNSLTLDAAKAQESFLVRIEKTKEEFFGLIRAIGETSSVKNFLNFSLNLASSFTKLGDALRPVLPLLATFAGVKVIQGFGSLTRGFATTFAQLPRAATNLAGVGTGLPSPAPVRRKSGGIVPGTGSGDIVPARVPAGSFVVRKQAARKAGYNRLSNMARGYQAGGLVDVLLEPGEFVFDDREAARVGLGSLKAINKTGEVPTEDPRTRLAMKLKRKAAEQGMTLPELMNHHYARGGAVRGYASGGVVGEPRVGIAALLAQVRTLKPELAKANSGDLLKKARLDRKPQHTATDADREALEKYYGVNLSGVQAVARGRAGSKKRDKDLELIEKLAQEKSYLSTAVEDFRNAKTEPERESARNEFLGTGYTTKAAQTHYHPGLLDNALFADQLQEHGVGDVNLLAKKLGVKSVKHLYAKFPEKAAERRRQADLFALAAKSIRAAVPDDEADPSKVTGVHAEQLSGKKSRRGVSVDTSKYGYEKKSASAFSGLSGGAEFDTELQAVEDTPRRPEPEVVAPNPVKKAAPVVSAIKGELEGRDASYRVLARRNDAAPIAVSQGLGRFRKKEVGAGELPAPRRSQGPVYQAARERKIDEARKGDTFITTAPAALQPEEPARPPEAVAVAAKVSQPSLKTRSPEELARRRAAREQALRESSESAQRKFQAVVRKNEEAARSRQGVDDLKRPAAPSVAPQAPQAPVAEPARVLSQTELAQHEAARKAEEAVKGQSFSSLGQRLTAEHASLSGADRKLYRDHYNNKVKNDPAFRREAIEDFTKNSPTYKSQGDIVDRIVNQNPVYDVDENGAKRPRYTIGPHASLGQELAFRAVGGEHGVRIIRSSDPLKRDDPHFDASTNPRRPASAGGGSGTRTPRTRAAAPEPEDSPFNRRRPAGSDREVIALLKKLVSATEKGAAKKAGHGGRQRDLDFVDTKKIGGSEIAAAAARPLPGQGAFHFRDEPFPSIRQKVGTGPIEEAFRKENPVAKGQQLQLDFVDKPLFPAPGVSREPESGRTPYAPHVTFLPGASSAASAAEVEAYHAREDAKRDSFPQAAFVSAHVSAGLAKAAAGRADAARDAARKSRKEARGKAKASGEAVKPSAVPESAGLLTAAETAALKAKLKDEAEREFARRTAAPRGNAAHDTAASDFNDKRFVRARVGGRRPVPLAADLNRPDIAADHSPLYDPKARVGSYPISAGTANVFTPTPPFSEAESLDHLAARRDSSGRGRVFAPGLENRHFYETRAAHPEKSPGAFPDVTPESKGVLAADAPVDKRALDQFFADGTHPRTHVNALIPGGDGVRSAPRKFDTDAPSFRVIPLGSRADVKAAAQRAEFAEKSKSGAFAAPASPYAVPTPLDEKGRKDERYARRRESLDDLFNAQFGKRRFHYEGTNQSGETVRGEVHADSRVGVGLAAHGRGHIVKSLKAIGSSVVRRKAGRLAESYSRGQESGVNPDRVQDLIHEELGRRVRRENPFYTDDEVKAEAKKRASLIGSTYNPTGALGDLYASSAATRVRYKQDPNNPFTRVAEYKTGHVGELDRAQAVRRVDREAFDSPVRQKLEDFHYAALAKRNSSLKPGKQLTEAALRKGASALAYRDVARNADIDVAGDKVVRVEKFSGRRSSARYSGITQRRINNASNPNRLIDNIRADDGTVIERAPNFVGRTLLRAGHARSLLTRDLGESVRIDTSKDVDDKHRIVRSRNFLGRVVGSKGGVGGLRRFGLNAQNGGLLAAAFAPSIIEGGFGTVQAPKGSVEAAARGQATSGGITGAAVGAQVGGLVGPLGAAVGAAAGGLFGFVTALKDAKNQIEEVKFEKAFASLEHAIDDVASGRLAPTRANVGRVNTGIAASISEASRRVEADGGGGTFLDRHLRGTTAGSVLDFVSTPFVATHNYATGSDNKSVFSSEGDVLKDEAKQRRAKEAELLGPQLGNFQAVGDKVAASVRLKKADLEVSSRTPDSVLEARRAARAEAFKAAGGAPIADAISRAKNVPVSQVLESFDRLILETNKARVQEEGLARAANLAEISLSKFSRLGNAVEAASASILGLQGSADTIASLFHGQASAGKVSGLAEGASQIGGLDRKAFGSSVDFVRNSLGGGASGLAANFSKALTELDSLKRDLPSQIVDAVRGGDFDEDSISGDVSKAFQGYSPEVRKRLEAASEGFDRKELLRQVNQNPEQLAKDLIDRAVGDQARQHQDVAGQLQQHANRRGQGYAEAEALSSAQGETLDRGSLQALSSRRAEASLRAFREHRSASDFLSLSDLRAPAEDRQRRLAGNAGLDPNAIGRRLTFVRSQVDRQQAVINDAGSTDAQRDAAQQKFASLTAESARLQEALKHLADTSGDVAAIQEKLAENEKQRSSQLNYTEKLLTARPGELLKMQQHAGLADVAVAQGGFGGFNAKQIGHVLEYLRSLGDLKLPGYGNRTGNQVAEGLLDNARQRVFGGRARATDREAEGLLGEQARVEGRGGKALEVLARQQAEVGDKFLSNLKEQNTQFLSKMDALIKAASLKDAAGESGRAAVSAARAGNAVARVRSLDAEFGTGPGDNGLDRARRIAASPKLAQLKDATLGIAAIDRARKSGVVAEARRAFSHPVQDADGHGFSNLFGHSIPHDRRFPEGEAAQQEYLDRSRKALENASDAIAEKSGLTRDQVRDNVIPEYVGRLGTAMKNNERFPVPAEFGRALDRGMNSQLDAYKGQRSDAISDVGRNAYGRDLPDAGLQKKIEGAALNLDALSRRLQGLEAFDSLSDATKGLAESERQLDAANRAAAAARGAGEGAPPRVDAEPAGEEIQALRRAGGGGVFSPRGTDTVPAMLSPKEFVVNAASAQANAGILQTINAAKGPVYRAGGGFVGGNSPAPRPTQEALVPAGFAEGVRSFADAALSLSRALENCNIPSRIEVTTNNRVEVLLNGAQVLNAMKGDMAREITEQVVARLQAEVPRIVNSMPMRS